MLHHTPEQRADKVLAQQARLEAVAEARKNGGITAPSGLDCRLRLPAAAISRLSFQ